MWQAGVDTPQKYKTFEVPAKIGKFTINRILPKFPNLNCEEMVCNGVKYYQEKDADSYYSRPKREPLNPVTSLFASPHLPKNADPSFPLPICYAWIQQKGTTKRAEEKE